MLSKYLKNIRVYISLIVFCFTSIFFLDFVNPLPNGLTESVYFIQFIPSFIKFLAELSFYSIGFLIIVLLTLVWGRVYCSFLCPLGFLQDIISRFRKNKFKYRFFKDFPKTKYIILSLTIISIIIGTLLLVSVLDPFSNFGKIVTNLFKPILVIGNNVLVEVLEAFDNYSISPVKLNVSLTGFLFSIIILAIVSVMAFYKGRLFCNTICPVGTLLGLVSKISFFKIKVDENNCNGCGKCEKVCKSQCIESKTKTIDFDRCVGCFNCFDACPTAGIVFSPGIKESNKAETDEERRGFISSVMIYALGSSIVSKAQNKIVPKKESTIPTFKENHSTPPGAISNERFNDNCTACHLCISACPSKVLQPSFLEFGALNILHPVMDYKTAYCNFECTICSEVCPTDAIKPINVEDKKLVQIGIAKFEKDNCIVITEETECGACSEHCPTKAVNMIPHKHLLAPEVIEDYCIGCGACEFACPTKPYKAIYVEGNIQHKTAKKNIQEKLEQDESEDFPF